MKKKKVEKFFEPEKESMPEVPAKPNFFGRLKKINLFKAAVIAIIFVIIGGLSSSTFYFYQKYKEAGQNSVLPVKDELTVIVEEIGKFMDLPDEIPALITVTDLEKMKSQPFFAKAESGDKVLVYVAAKKAILYRSSAKRIIETATVLNFSNEQIAVNNLPGNMSGEVRGQEAYAQPQFKDSEELPADEDSRQPAAPKVQKTPVRVAIYNGASINGLAAKIEGKIIALSGVQIQVTEKTNAQGNYAQTLIIDLSGGNGEALEKIKAVAGGEIGELPDGEAKPDADILIISGSDQK